MSVVNEIDWPPWYQRVAARLPFWRNEGLLLFPFGIIAVVTANASSIDSGSDLLSWVLAALVGAALGVLFIGLFPLPFTRREIPRLGAIAVIVAASGTGAIFALGVSITARILGLPDSDPLWWRVLGSAIIIGWFSIVLTLALDARSRLRRQGDVLVDEAIALESARLSTTAIGEEMHRAVTEEVETALATARESLGGQTTDAAAAAEFARWPEIAAELRATAAETVRPLSRQLWDSAPGDRHRPRPWSLLAFIVNRQPLRPLAASVIYAVGQISTLLQQESSPATLTRTVIGIAEIWIIMTIANALMRRAPRYHALLFVSAALVLQVPVVVSFLVEAADGTQASSPTGMVATVIAGLIVIVATSAFGAVRGLTQSRLDSMSIQIDSALVESTARSRALAHVLREASAIVHGAVQARLLGCAIAVEEAGQNKDPEKFSAALARARTALEYPLVSLGRPAASSLIGELTRRRELWDGLCDVTYSIDTDVPELPTSTVADCGRIVEEAISNAVRHGDARCVTIRIDIEPDATGQAPATLRVIITDDGRGLGPEVPQPGLGLRMIQSVTTHSTLAEIDGHACLTVNLPLE